MKFKKIYFALFLALNLNAGAVFDTCSRDINIDENITKIAALWHANNQ